MSLVPAERTCTLLDFAHPTCGFNPLAVDAPADVIADYVVAALQEPVHRRRHPRVLGSVPAQRDHRRARYDRSSTLWDAARLLSVGEEGYAYRARVGARVRALPEFKEISEFFTAELTAQLADSRIDDDRQARRAGEQARAAAELAVDQARAAQRLAARRLRPGDRRT